MKKISWLAVVLITALYAQSCRHQECPAPVERELILKGDPFIKDAMITGYLPGQPRGKSSKLDALAWTFSGDPQPGRVLLQFNLSSIPHGAEIEKAELTLFADTTNEVTTGIAGHSQLTGSNSWNIQRITSPWIEDSVTWNNSPTFDNTHKISLPASTSFDQAYTIDITAFIKGQIANPDLYHGIILQLDTEVHYRIIAFCSKEHPYAATLMPSLKITFKR